MMRNLLLLGLFLLSFVPTKADITATYTTGNVSDDIDDGTVTVTVNGGTAPFQYYWSNQGTPLSSNVAEGLREGAEFTVQITDAKGEKTDLTVVVPTNSASEVINSILIQL